MKIFCLYVTLTDYGNPISYEFYIRADNVQEILKVLTDRYRAMKENGKPYKIVIDDTYSVPAMNLSYMFVVLNEDGEETNKQFIDTIYSDKREMEDVYYMTAVHLLHFEPEIEDDVRDFLNLELKVIMT
jgi:hypothetical protein